MARQKRVWTKSPPRRILRSSAVTPGEPRKQQTGGQGVHGVTAGTSSSRKRRREDTEEGGGKHELPRGRKTSTREGERPKKKTRTLDPQKRTPPAPTNRKPRHRQAPLTRRNLKLFDKMGRKATRTETDRDDSQTSKSGSHSSGAKSSKTGKTASTTASGFAKQAHKNGILPPRLSRAPENIDEIRQRFDAPRATASPTQSMYEYYVNTVETAPNEATMLACGADVLLKKYYSDSGYKQVYNQAFSGIPKDAGFNSGLSAPRPGFVEGLLEEQYGPFPVDECLPGGELFKDSEVSLALPHIAGEWKGPGKDMTLARVQSSYDGAALVYARQQALEYLGGSTSCYGPGHDAEVATFTTDGSQLNMYAHHATASNTNKNRKVQYHQHLVKSVNLVESYQSFKDGRRGLRNEQDHAREQSYALRDRLQKRWEQHEQRCEEVRAENARQAEAGFDNLKDDAEERQESLEDEKDGLDDGLETWEKVDLDEEPPQKKDTAQTRRSSRLSGKRKK